ncbi:plant intracellular Ras-group-related LRR protein 7 [Carex littledalei]|uniref:Plant intracellular Ras-group-related LRR protein 7 n=1 Tax=Carex littledalei TaxID=544730 RepID=A0A833V8L0_9POAL|nr:plant intracellular Ras-group-related LRR protein 7 [Carex littledalei]
MGCCVSTNSDSSANRVARWRSTGIVALRDTKLKALFFLPLESIRTLDLTNNKIGIIFLTLLQVLANNIIQSLPTNIGDLRTLKILTLDGNRITYLPDELGSLQMLEKLSISRNSLISLPQTIGDLRNIVLLNVSQNKLKSLPESIGGCIALEELQASENSIDDLPLSICKLVHLKSLLLNNNNIRQLPQNLLKECKALQSISLHDNPISMDQFQQMDGFEEFESRRRKKFDKQIDSNVMMSSTALDEGLDRR